MKVQIENNLFIESDERQFILKEYSGKQGKDGNDLFKIHGYYGSVNAALRKVLKMKVMESTAKNLTELIADIERIEKYIDSKISA